MSPGEDATGPCGDPEITKLRVREARGALPALNARFGRRLMSVAQGFSPALGIALKGH